MSGGIGRVDRGGDFLRVWLTGCDVALELPWLWIRDHSHTPEALDPATLQRTVDTFSLESDLAPTGQRIEDRSLRVSWPDGIPDSVLPIELLRELQGSSSARVLWSVPDRVSPESAGLEDLIGSDEMLASWLAGLDRVGFGLVDAAPGRRQSVEELAGRIGYVRRTIFGDVWRLSSAETDHADTAYRTTYLEPHSDGTYSHDGPGLQLFACAERTGDGGESILVDGFAAAETLRRERPDDFDRLCRVAVPGRYLEPGIELRAAQPTIRTAPDGAVVQVSFNNHDRAPFLLPPPEMAAWYRAYGAFHDLIVEDSRWWTHRLEPGEMLVFDNWRCLHGRMAFTGTRVFHGCYLNHEDYESRLRTLGGR